MSETAIYRHLTKKYCYRADGEPGCGVDVASQGDSVVPWAMGLDLPSEEFKTYCGHEPPKRLIQMEGHGDKLPFLNESLDFVYSSHLLEDFPPEDRKRVMAEWLRVLRPGGNLVILVPERARWAYAITVLGQCPNCRHSLEPVLGELSAIAKELGLEVLEERLTECHPNDYNILFAARKV